MIEISCTVAINIFCEVFNIIYLVYFKLPFGLKNNIG